ncbi:hypothetical protein CDD80_818 [Ophiocordyceps camponoti-rufipedis]|uniref:SRP9 domain-containing protein n=1 Tax=Ophiocordyceps camponoti-rufipedis TaxID=2004952 RepID=A0A2C5ZBV4_9HYPO|nr:hypothetical protein CDD80_818 [Ophiocordyceps camponoti-rufipedis]
MPYFSTSQEWLDQSALLLEARPTTVTCPLFYKQDRTTADENPQTRVTTRYSIKAVKPPRDQTPTDKDNDTPRPPRASLVLKTYDPVSGVTLKYRTTKAAEVSRLVHASLGRLARTMAALPDAATAADNAGGLPEEPMPDAPPVAGLDVSSAVSGREGKDVQGSASRQQSQVGGAGHKKKKGRR